MDLDDLDDLDDLENVGSSEIEQVPTFDAARVRGEFELLAPFLRHPGFPDRVPSAVG